MGGRGGEGVNDNDTDCEIFPKPSAANSECMQNRVGKGRRGAHLD